MDSSLTPLVEVFSEHGNSLERDGLWPMVAHSMGGVIASQTVAAQLERGLHIGFTAGTDNHFGHPGTYGEGLTGVLADALTRESIFDALRRRHTFAVTGDRIRPSIDAEGATMGDVRPPGGRRRMRVGVEPLAPLDYVQVWRNGRPVHTWSVAHPETSRGGTEHLVRIEWGWGRLEHDERTQWTIRIAVDGGRIVRADPCFCGGAGSTELVNRLVDFTPPAGEVRIESYTSRLNTFPVSGVVLRIDGAADTRLVCEAEAVCGDERGGCRIARPMRELIADDHAEPVLDRFSSPRLRVGRALACADLAFGADWTDLTPTPHDTYFIKAQQTNGQIAWTSPILFGEG
jgi:hypothetical protein